MSIKQRDSRMAGVGFHKWSKSDTVVPWVGGTCASECPYCKRISMPALLRIQVHFMMDMYKLTRMVRIMSPQGLISSHLNRFWFEGHTDTTLHTIQIRREIRKINTHTQTHTHRNFWSKICFYLFMELKNNNRNSVRINKEMGGYFCWFSENHKIK